MEHVTLKHVQQRFQVFCDDSSRVLGAGTIPISAEARDAITKAAKVWDISRICWPMVFKTSVSKEAVITPSITNPFYTSMTMGIEGELSAKGYNMLVYFRPAALMLKIVR